MGNQYSLSKLEEYIALEKEAATNLEYDDIRDIVLNDFQRTAGNNVVTLEEIDKKIQEILGMIDTKYHHSIQVASDSKSTVETLGFNEEIAAFIELSALLHDIGRFEQARVTGTFYESELEKYDRYRKLGIKDHGELGRFILQCGMISEIIPYTRKYDTAVIAIVGEHAKGILPGCLGDKVDNLDVYTRFSIHEVMLNDELMSRLTALNVQIIQDADRIDIYHQVIGGKWVPLMSDEPIADEVFDMFFRGEYLDIQQLRTRGLWNFNVGELVRLSFVNQLRLVGVAKVINQQQLIQQMYQIRNIEERSIMMPRLKEAYEYTIEQMQTLVSSSPDGVYLPQKVKIKGES